jgi:hypothetical protein
LFLEPIGTSPVLELIAPSLPLRATSRPEAHGSRRTPLEGLDYAALGGDVLRKRLAQLFRRFDRSYASTPERLEVHREVVRSSLGPERRLLGVGDRVIRGVVLDEREAFGVVTEALVRLLRDVRRVPAALEERGIRPGARADANLRAGRALPLRSGRLPRHRARRHRPSARCASTTTAIPKSTTAPTNVSACIRPLVRTRAPRTRASARDEQHGCGCDKPTSSKRWWGNRGQANGGACASIRRTRT